jgi:beta-lactamase regulating signal transducer with metallopeptidase domain
MISLVGAWLVSAAIKGSLILALAAITVFALRRASAATRHLVWTVAIAGVFLAPLLGATLPSVSVSIDVPDVMDSSGTPRAANAPATAMAAQRAEQAGQRTQSPERSFAAAAAEQVMPAGAGPSRSASQPGLLERVDARLMLLVTWMIGSAVLLIHFAVGVWNASRLVRRSRAVENEAWQVRLENALARVGFRRGVVLLVSDETTVPITCGIRRPVIVLPREAFTWPDERANVVLLHEAAHIVRRDCLVQYLAQTMRALHWFNPLAWIAAARLTAERERACDDLVLAAGTRGSSYAEHLLDIARSLRGRQAPMAALAMARPSELEGRLLSILDAARQRRVPTRRAVLTVVAMASVGIAGIAAVRLEPAVEARAHPVPVDLTQVVAQGLPAPKPTPTPAPAPMPAPTPVRVRPAPPAGPAERQPPAKRQDDGDNSPENPEESKVDAATRDAVARALLAALKDEDREVRSSAMASLMRLRSPLALEPMMAALRDSHADIREHAAFALGQLGDERAVPVLTAALQDQNAEVREKAVFALGQIRSKAAVPGLQGALKDSDPEVRQQAAFALGQLHAPEAVAGLIAALKDAHADVRKQAAFALGQIGDASAISTR